MHFSYLFFTSGKLEFQSKFVKSASPSALQIFTALDRLFTTFPRKQGSYQVTEVLNKSCVEDE